MNLKLLALRILLIAIAAAAHPWGPWKNVGEELWSWLAPLGLDVAMTPVTYDMTFMLDPESRDRAYTRSARFVAKGDDVSGERDGRADAQATSNNTLTLPLREADFHRVRIPLLLMAELVPTPASIDVYVRAVCRSLSKQFGREIDVWTLELAPPSPSDSKIGANRAWRCRGANR